MHARLTALGYIPQSGNHYLRGDRAIDLLVPTEAKPGPRIIGERAFDGAPGLRRMGRPCVDRSRRTTRRDT